MSRRKPIHLAAVGRPAVPAAKAWDASTHALLCGLIGAAAPNLIDDQLERCAGLGTDAGTILANVGRLAEAIGADCSDEEAARREGTSHAGHFSDPGRASAAMFSIAAAVDHARGLYWVAGEADALLRARRDGRAG